LARLRGAKKQIEVRLDGALPGLRIGHSAVLAISGILRWLARAGTGADENKTTDKFGMTHREGLRDISANRETQQIDLRKSERSDEIGSVLRHCVNRVGRLTA
jgi:hypothetical protein